MWLCIVNAGRELGDNHLACDARLVARWEDGDVECPRPAYQRALTALTGRPFHLLGFRSRNAIELPSTDDLAPGRLSLQVDEEGQVWATIGRRTFLVGTSAALLTRMGLTETGELLTESPLVGNADLFGFGAFMNERWPDVRLSRPHPDYGVDYNALLPANRAVEGAAVQFQLQEARTMGGRAIVAVKDQLRWKDFARGGGRGLVAATSRASGRPRFFVMDVREARRHAALHGEASVAVPEAYELDDLTFALLWACASLDTGIQADDQELTVALAELAPYEGLPSSAVSREAAADLGTTAHMWLGSDFCARHILRNMEHLPDTPVFWTREQTGAEACPWLLFDHKYAYLRATSERFGDGLLARMFCVPQRAVAGSPPYERILLLLAIALMEATGIKVQVLRRPGLLRRGGLRTWRARPGNHRELGARRRDLARGHRPPSVRAQRLPRGICLRQRPPGDRCAVTSGPAARDGGLPRHRLAVAARPVPAARASRNNRAAAAVQPPHLHRRGRRGVRVHRPGRRGRRVTTATRDR